LILFRRSPGNLQLGWYLLNGDGEKIDSFYFDTPNLSSGGVLAKNMVYRTDTIFQMKRPKWDHNLEANIYGSSLSQKDSLFRWRYDWSDWGYTWINPSAMVETSDGHFLIIMIGFVQHPRSFFTLGMMIDREGNELWRREIDQFPKSEGFDMMRMFSDIIEIDGYFYFLGTYGSVRRESLIQKIDSEGRVIWSFEEFLGGSGLGRNHWRNLSPGPDSATIAFGSNRMLIPEELEDFEPGFYDRYSRWPPTITYLDTLDGTIIDEAREFSTKSKRFYGINGIINSQFNDDLIFCGFFLRTDYFPNDPFWHPEIGLVGRLGSDGEFKWIVQIPERWGTHHLGWYFMDLLEASNGDIILVGQARGLQEPNTTWIMRLGPDGCVPDQMYCSGDSLLIAHPDVFVSTESPLPSLEETTAFPNPVRSGDVITMQTKEESPPGEPAKLRWYSTSGEVVHTSLDVLFQVNTGYQLQVPENIPSGMYILDLSVGKYSYRAKVLVVD
jgi:hypothetical protein